MRFATMSLDEILVVFANDYAEYVETGELNRPLEEALYEHWLHEMPYGTAKARDGDPSEWIADRLDRELSNY